jgi:thiamine pyrophosphokinase
LFFSACLFLSKVFKNAAHYWQQKKQTVAQRSSIIPLKKKYITIIKSPASYFSCFGSALANELQTGKLRMPVKEPNGETVLLQGDDIALER